MKLFITYDELARRLNGQAAGGAVELAANEHLTPGAMDLVEQRQLTVRRLSDPKPMADNPRSQGTGAEMERNRSPRSQASGDETRGMRPPTGGSIGLVIQSPDEKVRGLVDSLYRDGLSLADFTVDDCWMVNLRSMCQAIAGGRLAAGVAVLPYAADAMVLANKVRGIRAVQGTSRASVSAGLRRFAANVLVVEHAVSTFHEIRSMVGAFAAERRGSTAARATMLLANLMELEGA